MTRSFGLVDFKVREAEYFLLELRRLSKQLNIEPVQFCASAFASATRSITFAMQASLKGCQDFEPWYERQRQRLDDDSLARFFVKFRNFTQKIGGGDIVGDPIHVRGRYLFFFIPVPDLPEVPEQDVVSACEGYFTTLLQIVYDCYIELGPLIDGQQYFTKEVFSALGKNIEDGEEELGFPHGWTDIGEQDAEPHRWQMLRNQADGCHIEKQFERWLDKTLPRPKPI